MEELDSVVPKSRVAGKFLRDLQDFHLGLIGLDLGHLDALQSVAQLETGKDVGQHILAAFHEGRLGMNRIENEIHALLLDIA